MKTLDSSIKNEEWGKDREEMMFLQLAHHIFALLNTYLQSERSLLMEKARKS